MRILKGKRENQFSSFFSVVGAVNQVLAQKYSRGSVMPQKLMP